MRSKEPLPCRCHGIANPVRGGAAEARSRRDRPLEAEHVEHLFRDLRMYRLHVRQRQRVEAAAAILGQLHDRAGDMMRLTERHAQRSDERSVGKESVWTCKYRWAPFH